MGGNRPSIETLGTTSTFGRDLELSARAMAVAPVMLILTMALAVLTARSGPLGPVVGLAMQLALAGFVGVQRIWFLRIWRRSTLELHEVGPLTWRFLGRYAALGLVLIAAFIPFLSLDLTVGIHHRAVIITIGIAFALIGDVALTFVTPALAYTTASVRDALIIGLRMLRSTWPRSAAYILTPGLVLVSFAYLVPRRTESLLIAALVSLVTLWFKGAVAAFYLRTYPETDGFGA